jgi:hypothetical protein
MPEVGSTAVSVDFQWAENQFGPLGDFRPGARGIVGACSIESYPIGSLRHTHADVQGFLSWLEHQGATPNFWFKDGEVLARDYLKETDNRQDTYGMDADCIFYHSGHGMTLDDGTFCVPMAVGWHDRFVAKSTEMMVGDGHCRYLFWSTCQSLRVSDGHTPQRTWGGSNRGVRMIFGFDTSTVDNPLYGQYFGLYRDAGHSFTTAWLKAGLAISTAQIPTVAAWAASADEAKAILNGERDFSDARTSPDHVVWCSAKPGAQSRRPHQRMPARVAMARLAPVHDRPVREITSQFAFDPPRGRMRGSAAGLVARDGDRQLTMHADGTVNVRLSALDRVSDCGLAASEAYTVAEAAVREYRLGRDESLVLEHVIPLMAGSATTARPDQPAEQWRSGFMVRYRQVIDVAPVLTPQAGTVDLVVGNAGSVVSITDTVRPVEALQEGMVGAPAGPGRPSRGADHPEALLSGAIAELVLKTSAGKEPAVTARPVPGTAEYGYEVEGKCARLIAHCLVELDYGNGCRKRHRVQTPVVG